MRKREHDYAYRRLSMRRRNDCFSCFGKEKGDGKKKKAGGRKK